ncbi:hypothetical protein JT358_10070 [Micrococcales bacterium 31B]|nr:hypothetical protein [Micrococcales bacterium 31B]
MGGAHRYGHLREVAEPLPHLGLTRGLTGVTEGDPGRADEGDHREQGRELHAPTHHPKAADPGLAPGDQTHPRPRSAHEAEEQGERCRQGGRRKQPVHLQPGSHEHPAARETHAEPAERAHAESCGAQAQHVRPDVVPVDGGGATPAQHPQRPRPGRPGEGVEREPGREGAHGDERGKHLGQSPRVQHIFITGCVHALRRDTLGGECLGGRG